MTHRACFFLLLAAITLAAGACADHHTCMHPCPIDARVDAGPG